MKKLKYSPEVAEKLKSIKCEVEDTYGKEIAKRVVGNMTKAFRRLQQFEQSGVSVERTIGFPCDYYMVYVEHNYAFYRITEDAVWIIDIFHEREDFMWGLFRVKTISQETEDYWRE